MRPYRFSVPVEGTATQDAGDYRRKVNLTKLAGRMAAILIGGSGLLNLLSLLGGPVPTEQPGWVLLLFPLDFAGVSRTLTLIAGFGIVLIGVHLMAGKRRAWQAALGLAAGSVLFHLTRGWNLEEALSSAWLVLFLWCTRRAFPLGAERPRLGRAAVRAVVAFAVAAGYGTTGFWLLERGEFHRNFHWREAATRTIQAMLLLNGSDLVPHTAYAAWFLDSLFWMSGAALLYSGVVLFRPAVYRFSVNLDEAAVAGAIAEKYGRTGQDFFKHWPDKSYFFTENGESFLGYRVWGSYALALGDPVGPESETEQAVKEFMEFCRRRGWRAGFHQVSAESAPVYERLGFRRLKVGDDAIVDLKQFSLGGSAMKEFRNTVNRLDRLGYRVERRDPPLADPLLSELKRISDEWLEAPGHRERQFTLGRFESWYVRSTPVYVVFDGGDKPVAFLNLVPAYDPEEASVDLMRRSREAPNGVMDYLFARVFLDLRAREVRRFNLGMAPLSDEKEGKRSDAAERFIHWAMKRMPGVFRVSSLRRFKAKYAHSWQPRYAVFESRFDLARLGLALRRITEIRPEDAGTEHAGSRRLREVA